MPHLSVWMVRTSLLNLGVGFTAGMLLLFNKGVPFDPSIWKMLPVHIEMVLLGWTMQLAMGVSFWVLPRFSNRARYGVERLGWIAYVLLNAGVGIYVFGVSTDHSVLSLLGRGLEFVSIVCFIVLIWPRVKALSKSSTN